MRKIGLSVLLLVAIFVFGSVKTYAQMLSCANKTTLVCVGSCHQQDKTAYAFSETGDFDGSLEATCCSQVVPGMWLSGSEGCLIDKNITKTMHKELAYLALHNRVFLVACNGDLVPFQNSAQDEPTWSANRALSSDIGKVATRTR